MLELRAEGYDQQDWQFRYAIERQIEQLARGRVDPMHVLENHQNRPGARQRVELVQQRFEQHLTLTLRAQIEFAGRVRQRQQLGQ